jgi:hypothetical protein
MYLLVTCSSSKDSVCKKETRKKLHTAVTGHNGALSLIFDIALGIAV